MTRIFTSLALGAALLAASALTAAAEKLPLADISAYLNRMTSASAEFTQINDDGSLSTGTLHIKRPGRMRFEYDPPNDALVVAGGGAVVIVDPKSNQPAETYALNRTPLSIILEPRVDLGQANMVVGHSFDGTATVVRAQDPAHPEYGSIELSFTDAPVQLRKWVINDDGGGRTTVVLGDLDAGRTLPDTLFNTQALGADPGR
jgi:outer membrane lipoprotein-sorting protein